MKLLVVTLVLCAGQSWLFGQGAINFSNRNPAPGPDRVVAPIYGPEPNPFIELHGNATTNGGYTVYSGALLTGTAFTAQLWAVAANEGPNFLAPISTTVFRSNPSLPGFIQPPLNNPVIVPNTPHGDQAIFDLRVWDNRGGTVTSWAMVLADPTVPRGTSGNFTTVVYEPPTLAPSLVGLTSFNLHVVPEPSLAALGALGLLALLLVRQKSSSPSRTDPLHR